MARDFVDVKDGDRLEPFHINQIYKELRRLRKLRGSVHVQVDGMQDPDGVPQISVVFPPGGWLAVANGTITASVGNTVGTGTVTILQLNGNSVQAAQVNNLTVKNPTRDVGTVPGEISDGKRVWVQKDGFGDFWVAPLECEDP